MNFVATKQHVANRGVPPDSFLEQLVLWAKSDPVEIFEFRADPPKPKPPIDDVYNLIKPQLGPWTGLDHRRSAMVEMMRVLAGFESSWNWNEGPDVTNPSENNPETMSAGAWQCSWNSRSFGQDLKDLAAAHGVHDGVKFQQVTKSHHPFAMEWVARLTRHTTHHHGPLLRHDVNPWLRRDAMVEFQAVIGA